MSKPYVVNVANAPTYAHPQQGAIVFFENPEKPFPELGINIRILQPGEANARYHSENQQEDFLVLGGRCTLTLEGEEHPLRGWAFVPRPAGPRHAFIGAGDGPCWILMVGARGPDEQLDYPVDATAAAHGASVAQPTRDPDVAYADRPGDWEPARPPWPPTPE